MILIVLVHLGLLMIGMAEDLMVVALQIAGKLKVKKNCIKKLQVEINQKGKSVLKNIINYHKVRNF